MVVELTGLRVLLGPKPATEWSNEEELRRVQLARPRDSVTPCACQSVVHIHYSKVGFKVIYIYITIIIIIVVPITIITNNDNKNNDTDNDIDNDNSNNNNNGNHNKSINK